MLVDDGRLLQDPLNWRDVHGVEELLVYGRNEMYPLWVNGYENNPDDEITAGAALASRSTTKSTACTATMLCIRPDVLFSITRTSRKAPLWLISTAHGASRSICAFVKS